MSDLAEQLRERGFTPLPKNVKPVEAVARAIDSTEESEESSDEPDLEYGYLLNLPPFIFNLEKAHDFCVEIDKMNEAVEDMKKAEPRSLWLRDLEFLDAELDKLDVEDAEAEAERQRTRKLDVDSLAEKDFGTNSLNPSTISEDHGVVQCTYYEATISEDGVVDEVAPAKGGRKPAKRKTEEEEVAQTMPRAEASSCAMDIGDVVEVAKPKGRQGAKKKAPAGPTDAKADDEEMLDPVQRLAQCYSGSTSENPSEISIPWGDDHDDDMFVKVARKLAKRMREEQGDSIENVAAGTTFSWSKRVKRTLRPFNGWFRWFGW